MENREEINIKSVGQRIREEREKLGLSRGEFAEIIGLSDYYVGQLERGERQMSLPVLSKIARCLHTSLDYLIFGKTATESCYICEENDIYETGNGDKNIDKNVISKTIKEINLLLNKCSLQELVLIKKIIKTIIPYTGTERK